MEIKKETSIFEAICHKLEFKKNTISNLHWHDKYEICQVLRGNLRITVEGEEFCVSPGDVVTINERALHLFATNDEDVIVRIFQFSTSVLLNFSNSFKQLTPHIKAADIKKVAQMESTLEALFEFLEAEKSCGKDFCNPYLQSLAASVYFLLERNFQKSENAFSGERDRREFYQIIEYVNAHFYENITVETIAKALYLSRNRLSSVFKKYANEKVVTYINKLRIKNVNTLLSRGIGITEAALESGFQSIRSFNDVYRDIMQMTPSEYIKRKK